jgi:hypothetical protein
MQKQTSRFLVRIFIDVFNAIGIKGGSAANDAVDFVAFVQQELAEVRTILSSDASKQGTFLHNLVLVVS